MSRSVRAKWVLIFIFGVPLAIFVFGIVVKLLWNNVLVPVIHVSEITFWQGLGILVLSKILFGSFAGGNKPSDRDQRKNRMMWKHMTPEQREQFKEEWRCRSRRWGQKPKDANQEPGSEAIQPQS